MAARTIETVSVAVMALLVLVGGSALLQEMAQLHGVAISALAVVAIVILYAFRRNYRAGVPSARLHAARDAAFLAAIVAAVAFVAGPARWSLGTAVAALEIGLVIELVGRIA
ncbi:MAG: hypothetical protein GIX03_02150 [Candidatus Eremiobacteraeota bacterium]|nr:hypothetical protein [Candidatus Eremiobacteraeota bacterium]MBC5801819.1 hypothetical protein [Candidatus Eremiobacteraeota bacterium]MBC5820493.1 hypothetical protein [Candidatus Eremiobacteraeota bacterium]